MIFIKFMLLLSLVIVASAQDYDDDGGDFDDGGFDGGFEGGLDGAEDDGGFAAASEHKEKYQPLAKLTKSSSTTPKHSDVTKLPGNVRVRRDSPRNLGKVFTYVKTDNGGHFKWGVRHGVYTNDDRKYY